jgi:5-methyltetrahydropteroyltriglutamate--homocysteine methyltransferase
MPITGQLTGYPRIGPNRELKWALERFWSGRGDRETFDLRIAELRSAHLAEQRDLVGSAVDDFFLYDPVLESALMFGIAPAWASDGPDPDPFAALTAVTRGTPQHEAWEMTKWFDTNYHYVVPEIDGPIERLSPLPWREPLADPSATWAIVGPYSFVKLSRLSEGADASQVAASIGQALWSWVRARGEADPAFRLQLDEPCLGLTMSDEDVALRDAAYAGFAGAADAQLPLVTVQFGRASGETIGDLGGSGLVVQIALDQVHRLQPTAAWAAQPELAISVIDGRSVWPDDYETVRAALGAVLHDERPVRLIPSTSLMFLPYTIEGETLPAGFQFAREKARTLARWTSALASAQTMDITMAQPASWPPLRKLQPRVPRADRRAAQADLNLPPYPTTTIGSLPQTADVRHLRVQLASNEIDRNAYDAAIGRLITDAIGWQEAMGLDVLVHGEFERTDMVEYFAEQMDGYHTTRNGWVLSYGSRCTRPPILAAPPSISAPMTVNEWRLAQSATNKPVKGMLTGPVTIVNWSFRPPGVPDDLLFWAVAQPVAQEIGYLVEAGARVIQVDEPAVRERWPLPTDDAQEQRAVYSRGVRAALGHVFNQPAHVQMHTHMCYGTDATIAPLWSDAGVDVASIWYARSHDDDRILAFYEASGDGHVQIGPGVFDVHSPHTPGSEAMTERLHHVEGFMDAEDVWVNPDCGLKTRTWHEVERQLGDMVAAARARREASTAAAPPRAEV